MMKFLGWIKKYNWNQIYEYYNFFFFSFGIDAMFDDDISFIYVKNCL